jgi:hypothetical protein
MILSIEHIFHFELQIVNDALKRGLDVLRPFLSFT